MTVTTPADAALVAALQKQLGNTGKAPTTRIEVVTPDIARDLLERNRTNRSLRSPVAAAYGRDLADGKWELTGETIKIDWNGNLLDGQHRLSAVLRANVPMTTYVTRDLDPAVQDVIDSGIARVTGDLLTFRGIKNAFNVGSLARFASIREKGGYAVAGSSNSQVKLRPTHMEILDWVDAHPDAEAFVGKHVSFARTLGASVAATLYAFYEMHQKDADAAEEFIESLANYATTGVGDPRLTLLIYLRNRNSDGRRFSPAETYYLLIRTWNAWRKGEKLDKITTTSRTGSIKVPAIV